MDSASHSYTFQLLLKRRRHAAIFEKQQGTRRGFDNMLLLQRSGWSCAEEGRHRAFQRLQMPYPLHQSINSGKTAQGIIPILAPCRCR